MNTNNTRSTLLLIALLVIIAAGAYWIYTASDADVGNGGNGPGTTTPDNTDNMDGVTSIDWDEDAITDQNGAVLIAADDFPGSIQISDDEDAEFGVAGTITDAQLSPDGTWLAAAMSGAAHGSGWLYNIEGDELHPVSFQYGGGVEVEAWSPDNNFVAFLATTPAPTDLLKIVDRRNIGDSPAETGFVIEAAEEADLSPPFSYAFVEWQQPHTLCYTLEDADAQCINAETQEPEE